MVATEPSRVTKALVVAASGPHERLLQIALPSYERFAASNGYELQVSDCSDSLDRPPAWAKVKIMRRALDEYDFCLWVDSDALIVRFTADPLSAMPEGSYLALAPHPQGWIAAPNTGVCLLRSCQRSKDFLDAVWASADVVDHIWWEQAAVARLLGFSVEGDLSRHSPTEWAQGFSWLPMGWNSQQLKPHFPRSDEWVRHYCGGGFIGRSVGQRGAWMQMDAEYAAGHAGRAIARYSALRIGLGVRRASRPLRTKLRTLVSGSQD